MIKAIIKDHFLLQQKSLPASREDLDIIQDLIDTFQFHRKTCLGMAANMIGCFKTMMIVADNDQDLILINPEIIDHSTVTYETAEGCLCHGDVHHVKRYAQIKVVYCDKQFKKRIKTFRGLTAQIIQHELDHFEGKLI